MIFFKLNFFKFNLIKKFLGPSSPGHNPIPALHCQHTANTLLNINLFVSLSLSLLSFADHSVIHCQWLECSILLIAELSWCYVSTAVRGSCVVLMVKWFVAMCSVAQKDVPQCARWPVWLWALQVRLVLSPQAAGSDMARGLGPHWYLPADLVEFDFLMRELLDSEDWKECPIFDKNPIKHPS